MLGVLQDEERITQTAADAAVGEASIFPFILLQHLGQVGQGRFPMENLLSCLFILPYLDKN